METEKLINDFTNLPPEAQRQVADFIAFLKARYRRLQYTKPLPSDIDNEAFIGIWKDREDLNDSSAWVRNMRKSEWSS